jgi:hypothetical protein
MPRFIGYTAPPATPPTTSAEWNSGTSTTDLADHITGVIFSDVAGTLYIEQSIDRGVNWDLSTSYAITANDGTGFKEDILAPFFRIRFVPGTNGATFRIAARLSSAGSR